ncbi:MAG: fluoride efflux transporter CrcB [Pseudomonas sp.]|jgi:CrcB protein|uniref:Fluoride-specific ion channel FluC n=1 Tax=Stutzerimonas stutzeri TaxID=316 RepID=A0A5S5B3C2_STUST|nr:MULTISPECIES: fluoride efflux transporter CrcB [Pseudomonadaceae]MAX91144.1 fluoride efflux transporter CrcB [Pseudomonas sp.]MBU0812051.1 fluoride efflux transporter CrcB [Gammaproteobacteria bacterium]MBK3848712.1 fluoride efflux transporter CrcB [Stutzerimonas xanthomarina]MBU0853783.1 fluoride efflux transporter CrcB [Gammaproteobacteria bacterium]MBU1301648.1 fluoride efflux transporter CrcB [Gammaproteobacteria bacterium]|tara:strand:+ start:4670 stop:5044 length:375 start_codon:yes stop_codon:yes gene_type:complete
MIRMALAVAAGGVVGTLIRFGVSTWVSAQWPKHFYLATLAVNVLGCLLIGYLYASFLQRPDLSPELRGGLIIGFLGALTTFSSFSLDGLRLLESGQAATAFSYIGVSVFGGLLAAWAGLALARL